MKGRILFLTKHTPVHIKPIVGDPVCARRSKLAKGPGEIPARSRTQCLLQRAFSMQSKHLFAMLTSGTPLHGTSRRQPYSYFAQPHRQSLSRGHTAQVTELHLLCSVKAPPSQDYTSFPNVNKELHSEHEVVTSPPQLIYYHLLH